MADVIRKADNRPVDLPKRIRDRLVWERKVVDMHGCSPKERDEAYLCLWRVAGGLRGGVSNCKRYPRRAKLEFLWVTKDHGYTGPPKAERGGLLKTPEEAAALMVREAIKNGTPSDYDGYILNGTVPARELAKLIREIYILYEGTMS